VSPGSGKGAGRLTFRTWFSIDPQPASISPTINIRIIFICALLVDCGRIICHPAIKNDSTNMKIYKACLICSLIIGLALFVRAANPHERDRPKGVYAENWIRISDLTGIVVNHMSSDKIASVLYVKGADKWIQVSVENPQGAVEGAN
jgi:hypothetical protein